MTQWLSQMIRSPTRLLGEGGDLAGLAEEAGALAKPPGECRPEATLRRLRSQKGRRCGRPAAELH